MRVAYQRAKEKPGSTIKYVSLSAASGVIPLHLLFHAQRPQKKMSMFSIAAKPSLILTPDILNPSRPAQVNIAQLSPLISWGISVTEKHVFLWRHSETIITLNNGPNQVLVRMTFFRT